MTSGDKVKISAVSYLNSTPFVYGIRQKLDPGMYSLELDNPAVCAQKLLEGRVDLGLVPVAVIPRLKEYHLISDYCIGANGPVRSVMLYSHVPLEKIEKILLDYQSRTSVLLTRLLAKQHWHIAPEWIEAGPGFEQAIQGNTAGVVIGDRTFSMAGCFPYTYDLAEEWRNFTGLPFVFACWVANKELPPVFVSAFNEALRFGLLHREEAVDTLRHLPAPRPMITEYLFAHISYELDENKKKGLNAFLKLSAAM